ncbi:DUF4349 domain-containing protein [Microbacterium sp. P03]|uniref:DUF4349 domain-containing protein n=1 Tax=Microbacterium sp. P03 TaxID=3366946 RepID=UPI003746AE07
MNTSDPENGEPQAGRPGRGADASATPDLPVLSAARIDEMESALFADIARDRASATEDAARRHRRRRRAWTGVGAAAAVVIVAAVISPMVLTAVSGSSGTASSVAAPAVGQDEVSGRAESGTDAGSSVSDLAGGESASLPAADGDQTRQIIATGSAAVAVDDIRVAIRQIGDAAVASGGFVESMTIGRSGVVTPIDGSGGASYDMLPVPAPTDGGWISVRVPSDELSALIDTLGDSGEVTASSISRQDVTDQSIDLRARIASGEASVARLTDLMAQAASVGDLIAAEGALAERQATLESYQQQLDYLQGQVKMSTLTVTVVPATEAVTADPAGFGDGLAAGWNGLVATLNGIVVALGFLLPWLVVIAIIGGVVWAITRAVRGRRARVATPPSDD